jgi:DNA-binding MarR family transcriptional regulator
MDAGTERATPGAAFLICLLALSAIANTGAQDASSDAPFVLGTDPIDRESYVPVNASIRIEFSEPMTLDSLLDAIDFRPSIHAALVAFSGDVIDLAPSSGLEQNTTYIVNITTEAMSARGVPMASEHGFHFHTGPGAPEALLWGRVTDESGAAVKDAVVEVVDNASGLVVATAKTDGEGNYYADVPPGRVYYLRIKHPDGREETTDPFMMNGDRTAPAPKSSKPKGPPPVIEPQPPWQEIATIGVLAGLGSLAGAIILGGEAARYALMMTFIAPYARMRRDRRRDDFVRGQVYGHILSNPGTTYGVIQKTVGVGNGTLSYHLYHLEREGFVRSERDGWFRRLYPAWAPRGAGDPILSDIQRKIFAIVETEPGLSQSDIALLMGESRQTVNYNVARLVDAGFLNLEGWGTQKKCFPAPPKPGPAPAPVPSMMRSPGPKSPPAAGARTPGRTPAKPARPGKPSTTKPHPAGTMPGQKPAAKPAPKAKKPAKPAAATAPTVNATPKPEASKQEETPGGPPAQAAAQGPASRGESPKQ